MKAFPWTCPFCGRNATINEHNYFENQSALISITKHAGQVVLIQSVIACPNPKCKEYEISVSMNKIEFQGGWVPTERFWEKQVYPDSLAKQFSKYIPEAIRTDYEEACKIKKLSPKASATLSRRCLQTMIRDFWQVKEKSLFKEIDAIKSKIDVPTYDAIDALRKIGNIGAHMEKDINLIIDVEPHEAELLIELIETLIEDWYIRREEKRQRFAKISVISASKAAQKKQGSATVKTVTSAAILPVAP